MFSGFKGLLSFSNIFSSSVAKLNVNFYMDRTMFSEGIVNIK